MHFARADIDLRAQVQTGNYVTCHRQCVIVIIGVVIGHPGNTRMHIGTAEIFGAHQLTRCCFDQWRAGQNDDRMKRMLRSTRPFSLPRYGAAARGSK